MKKKYYLLAVLLCLSMFIFAGCGNKDDNNAATESPSTESSADPQQTDKSDDLMDDVGDGVDDAVNDAGERVIIMSS